MKHGTEIKLASDLTLRVVFDREPDDHHVGNDEWTLLDWWFTTGAGELTNLDDSIYRMIERELDEGAPLWVRAINQITSVYKED